MSKSFLLENVAEKIELNFAGYYVEGISVLREWNGATGFIKMKPFDIEAADISNEEELNEIIKSLLIYG